MACMRTLSDSHVAPCTLCGGWSHKYLGFTRRPKPYTRYKVHQPSCRGRAVRSFPATLLVAAGQRVHHTDAGALMGWGSFGYSLKRVVISACRGPVISGIVKWIVASAISVLLRFLYAFSRTVSDTLATRLQFPVGAGVRRDNAIDGVVPISIQVFAYLQSGGNHVFKCLIGFFPLPGFQAAVRIHP